MQLSQVVVVLSGAAIVGVIVLAYHSRTEVEPRTVAGAVVAIVRAPAPEPSIDVKEVLDIRYALLRDDFAWLDRRLRWHLDSARANTGYEWRYRDAFGAFATADPTVRPHLDTWAALEPRSALARLARAANASTLASSKRGGKFVSETSTDQLRGMRQWHDSAVADLREAVARDSTNIIAHWLLLNAQIEQTFESRRAILDAAVRQVPTTVLVRGRYAHGLMRRWNDVVEARDEFANESDSASRVNPRLRLIRGMIPYDSGLTLSEHKHYADAVAMFTRALAYGDYWEYREGRGYAYYFWDQLNEAIADLDGALRQRPADIEPRIYRAWALHELAGRNPGALGEQLLRRARLDVCIAAELDSTDSGLRDILAKRPTLRPASMGGGAPISPRSATATLPFGRRC